VHLLNIVRRFAWIARNRSMPTHRQLGRSFRVATPIIVSQVPGGACKTAGFFTTSPTSAQVGTRSINTTRQFVFASEKLPFPVEATLRRLLTCSANKHCLNVKQHQHVAGNAPAKMTPPTGKSSLTA
jgi:hypothetical protein